MRSVLAVIAGNEMDRAVLDAALAVARPFHAKVKAFHPRYDPKLILPAVTDGLMGMPLSATLTEIEAQAADRAARARQSYEQWARRGRIGPAAEGSRRVAASFEESTGDPGPLIASAGRLSDLVVLERPGHPEHDTGLAVELALFESGRPVLLVPAGGLAGLPARMAVLWNGSTPAARAVGDGLELLAKAEAVAVISRADGERPTRPDGAQAAAYLQEIGVSATLVGVPADVDDPEQALLAAAADFGAGLIVMGAWSHSRLRELVLGGVTRHVLTHATVPVLLPH